MKSLEEADRVLLKALDAALTQDLGVLKSMGASEAELEAFAREQRLAYAEARFAVNSELRRGALPDCRSRGRPFGGSSAVTQGRTPKRVAAARGGHEGNSPVNRGRLVVPKAAGMAHLARMAKTSAPPTVQMRNQCPLALHGQINSYRHRCEYDSRQEAVRAILKAGLQALSAEPQPKPNGKLVRYAGLTNASIASAPKRATESTPQRLNSAPSCATLTSVRICRRR